MDDKSRITPQFQDTPDEQSQEILSQLQNDGLNPDVFEQIKNDPLFQQLNNSLQGLPSTDQEIQKLNDEERLTFEMCIKKSIQNHKRVEEKQKFIFKKGFKFVEHRFYQNQMKTHKKMKQNQQQIDFYEIHFKELSLKMNKHLTYFIHPQKKMQIGKLNYQSGFKSFNQPYIRTLLKSKSFRQEIKDYILNHFIQEVQEEMGLKLQKFIKYCSRMYEEALREFYMYSAKNDDEEYFRNYIRLKMEQSIVKNSKCKIPWSFQEVIDAQKFALNLIEQEMDVENE
ncbi:unnamed protein product (macronuclear) [Paramecium tetraurelia]|uniref:Uncharacterized protein n=1 Tax=Paramecium tetraurelia TaxID=5888 RepID=A0CGT7_PARTE|nr:uncharacterized protein GSPATT00007444001 [Paramecium tetraurelia]CAK70004.1 unnamed protein product [Paramecium tetraurelia]|eukprot:XP_001437401.1 hypothetical protein (macronuclear) [Paramecium tetraurelia strain d4-2]